MAKNNIIEVILFGQEIGKLGYDMDKRSSYFQYNPHFLGSTQLLYKALSESRA